MMRTHSARRFGLGIMVCAGMMGAGVWVVHRADAETARDAAATPTSERSEKRLDAKLDEVLANQHTILQRLDAVMEELRIIKVRATR